jgi:hypothetical protein
MAETLGRMELSIRERRPTSGRQMDQPIKWMNDGGVA